MTVGIDALNYYTPPLYLPIDTLAKARSIEYAKLHKGLGLEHMAVPDCDEDTASMAAQAVINVIRSEKLNPLEIGRIYLGTESALDAAKPTATYILEIVEEELKASFGSNCLGHCDALDMTFACVGGVDAMHNCLDWIRVNPSQKAIVVAADHAKYELNSTGEYTQGAGAVALLLTANPALLEIKAEFGVSTQSVSDFFKPTRPFEKSALLKAAAELLGQSLEDSDIDTLLENNDHPFWGHSNRVINLHKDEPVFDGPYSNNCYTQRISDALTRLQSLKPVNVLQEWDQLIFHLPYAFQGRRMITSLWIEWMEENNQMGLLEKELQAPAPERNSEDWKNFIKLASKSAMYKSFVEDKIEKGERASSLIGNMYTASIFMSLLSYLASSLAEGQELAHRNIGFFSYGSGSKSKVFTAEVMPTWKEKMQHISLFEDLERRKKITFEEYENLHNQKTTSPLAPASNMRLEKIGKEGVLEGYRYYR